jgi:hypothetical protein
MAKGPFKLVTVNTAPERARRLIGQFSEQVKELYMIEHVANCESESSKESKQDIMHTNSIAAIGEVEVTVRKHQPDVLVSLGILVQNQGGH